MRRFKVVGFYELDADEMDEIASEHPDLEEEDAIANFICDQLTELVDIDVSPA